MSRHQLQLPSARVIFLAIVVLMVVSALIGAALDGQTADTIHAAPAAH